MRIGDQKYHAIMSSKGVAGDLLRAESTRGFMRNQEGNSKAIKKLLRHPTIDFAQSEGEG